MKNVADRVKLTGKKKKALFLFDVRVIGVVLGEYFFRE